MIRKQTIQWIMGIFLASAIMSGWAVAGENATPEEVYQKVLQAHEVLHALGEEGLAAFKNREGEFVWKDSYVWVIECGKWTNAAHPIMPDLVGKNLKNIQCKKTGNLFFQEFCKVGRNPNGGWVEYFWPKPGQPKDALFRKITFVVPVKGTPWMVAAGIYNDSMSIEELNKTLR